MRLTRSPFSFLMNKDLPMRVSEADQPQFVKNSVLYKEFLAEREEILKHKWIESEKASVPVGTIDVAMHRDDVGTRTELPVVRASTLPLPLEKRTVVIIDDVLFTGRTVRAAMDAITSFGRPAKIQLAVLIDRGHRELPIRADYVGKNLPTASDEKVRLRLGEEESNEGVWLVKEETR